MGIQGDASHELSIRCRRSAAVKYAGEDESLALMNQDGLGNIDIAKST